MDPDKSEILSMLKAAQHRSIHPGWLSHSLIVGDAAGKIAIALNQSSRSEVDVDRTAKMGYLHDIGKTVGPADLHSQNGYDYLRELGFARPYCEICLTHSFVNNDPFCTFGDYLQPERDKFVIDFIREHEFTLEEKLVSLCDMLVSDHLMTMEDRIADVISRYGVGERTAERVRESMRLKRHFDELLGYDLYDLFPELDILE